MKKIKFLSLVLVALSAVLFISCSKDDDGGNSDVQKNEIYGEWAMLHLSSSTKEGNTNYDYDENFEENCTTTIIFNKKGEYIAISRDKRQNETKECFEVGTETGTYSIEGDKLSTSQGEMKIFELNDKFLTLISHQNFNDHNITTITRFKKVK
ncbi:hypothetical protein ACQ1Q1_04180 [Ornithobacterium rhinotracheale]|uniref:Lipocalin-like domain-containing protein n=1 Tax=Ornithobacterium rhinotracheale (strain ATCC 51463 / DSM 15997 / CCUG 23171 / CIP 104009 / LMG 9086) TaxID=867902 RepID=I3ZZ81_ORNRL|nr:hypothetical protein [Ornithobacterium rhinotracheale]AFL97015.1 hypothetical protein Ornrh_0819 [Ornithobacterium rhinotracheale DSM 15997]AIQ00433.1 hypothetical protein Q785_04655 [Ornithobacterium rhinotracheale ORT-UMN 88]KGB67382.1 hypothetical protein Q787_04530 [Ornithobacterium rhinotracheale H06-030791]MCK0194467.1 hypothetical protein [Ornithobacterium rhinotracheale]MCK0203655.1 hypothetical protein [Ornithobacterium rhinotracheale]